MIPEPSGVIIQLVRHRAGWGPGSGLTCGSIAATRLSAIRLSPLAAVSSRRTPPAVRCLKSNASVRESAVHEMLWEPSTPDPVNPSEFSTVIVPDQARTAPVASVKTLIVTSVPESVSIASLVPSGDKASPVTATPAGSAGTASRVSDCSLPAAVSRSR
jgi:hypothetical protein